MRRDILVQNSEGERPPTPLDYERPELVPVGSLHDLLAGSTGSQCDQFKTTGSPTTSGMATTYNGTATVTLKKGPVSDVPISIKLMGPRAMSLWIDPTKTEGHFGNTPIYGIQHGMQMQSMK